MVATEDLQLAGTACLDLQQSDEEQGQIEDTAAPCGTRPVDNQDGRRVSRDGQRIVSRWRPPLISVVSACQRGSERYVTVPETVPVLADKRIRVRMAGR